MAIFKKPVCENLKKKNRAMTRIDSMEDENTDSMLVYKPKTVKDSSIESLFNDNTVQKTGNKKSKVVIGVIVGILLFIGLVILLYNIL